MEEQQKAHILLLKTISKKYGIPIAELEDNEDENKNKIVLERFTDEKTGKIYYADMSKDNSDVYESYDEDKCRKIGMVVGGKISFFKTSKKKK
jgi:hypothetical protein